MITAILILVIMNTLWSILTYIALFNKVEQVEKTIIANSDENVRNTLQYIYNMDSIKEQAEAACGYGVTYETED